MTAWRFLAQRALTGEWLDRDVPLLRDELTWALSGPGALRGRISPDTGRSIASDGRPLFGVWDTLIYAEADGEIRWGGIVVRSEWDGPSWVIEAAGLTTYPTGVPYLGQLAAIGIDPADAFRDIWAHVQGQPDGDLGVVVDSTTTPVRLGTAAYREVEINGEWVPKSSIPASQLDPPAKAKLKVDMTSSSTSIKLATLGGYDKVALPFTVTIGSEDIRVTARSGLTLSGLTRGFGTTVASGHNAGTWVNHPGTPERTHEAEPYSLVWWEAPDCGTELDTLAKAAPFDYAEEHSWDGENVAHRVRIGYPRLGRRRDDLAFVQGDNVISVVTPERDGAELANEVVGIGSGEGKRALYKRIPQRDGRLRRPIVLSDKAVSDPKRLDALCRRELGTHSGTLDITSIEVVDHPNAVIGSWAAGDDILVQASIPWLGDIPVWCRITSWSLTGEDRAILYLRRSDAFTYGAL